VLQPAGLPAHPATPNKRLNLVIGLASGLLLGLVAAFAVDSLDDRILGARDLEETLGVSVVASIPNFRPPTQADELLQLPLGDGLATTALQVLAAALAAGPGRGGRVILVASAEHGDGRSTVAAGLAATLAASGHRVVLLSTDLRSRSIDDHFANGPAKGIVDIVERGLDPVEATDLPLGDGLLLVSAGAPTNQPALVLQSPKLRAFVAAKRADTDFLILDSSPASSSADAGSLAALADTLLLVVRPRHTKAAAAAAAIDQTSQTGVRNVVAVLNRHS
jgi:succinoglycan biosynthesis transport protein ExoP